MEQWDGFTIPDGTDSHLTALTLTQRHGLSSDGTDSQRPSRHYMVGQHGQKNQSGAGHAGSNINGFNK